MAKPARTEMPTHHEMEIEELLSRYVDAVRHKDLGAVMSCYAAEVVVFDLLPPLRHVGAEAYRKLWQQAFEMEGPFEYERHDLVIEAGDDLAFAYALDHTRFQEKGGGPGEMWTRWTGCLRRIDGAWKIVHEQSSVPMDMATGRAFTSLVP